MPIRPLCCLLALASCATPLQSKPATVMTITTPPRSRTAEQLLSLRGITKRFGAVRALSGVDLDVYAGEVVAIVGDNGAGKSTLVKILAGVHPQDSGTVSFGGVPTAIPSPTD